MIKKLLVPSFVLSAVVLLCSFTNNLVSAAATSTVSDQSGFPVIDVNELPPPSGNPPGITSNNEATITGTTTPNVAKISSVHIKEIKLDSDGSYSAGDIVKGTIKLSSSDIVDESNIYFDISLVGEYSKEEGHYNIPDQIYFTESIGPLLVKGGVNTSVPFSIKIPNSLGGKGLGVNVVVKRQSGIILGWSDVFLKEVKGGRKYLEIKDMHIKVGDTVLNPQSGPNISTSTKAVFYLKVSNSGKSDETITPNIEIHERSFSGKLVKKYSIDPVTIPAQKDKEVILKPYIENLPAGVYVLDVTLLDDSNNQRSSQIEYRYIIPGELAVIHDVKFEAKSVSNADLVNVNVEYSGAPYDILTGKNVDLKGAVVKVKIFDGTTNNQIGEGEVSATFDNSLGNTIVPVSINENASTIKVVSSIEKDSKILATFTSAVTTADRDFTPKPDKMLTYVLFGIGLIIILLIILYFLRNKPKKVILSIFFSLMLIGGAVMTKETTLAVNYTQNAWSNNYSVTRRIDDCSGYGRGWSWQTCTCPAGYSKDINGGNAYCYMDTTYPNSGAWTSTALTNPSRNYITSGEPIAISGYTATPFCGNLPSKTTVNVVAYSSPNNTDPWTPVPGGSVSTSASWGVYSGGNRNLWFSWPGFLFSGPAAGSAPNTFKKYLVNVNTYAYIQGDATAIHGYLLHHVDNYIDQVPVYVYAPVAVTCSADKTVVKIGETVNWTMTTSGGTGSYRYYWYNPTDQKDYVNSPQVKTLSKTYTTKGTKNMFAAIEDNYTQNNSNSNNGGWKQCSNTVTVADTDPITVSCTADKATPNVGEVVKWNATASGGTGQYTYVWQDPENSSAVSPQSSTLTKTYSSIGTKSVSVMVYDKAITGIVSTSQGVNAVCSTTVSLTCTAPQVLNGAGTACVTPLTCTAPQVINLAGTACITPLTCTLPQRPNSNGTQCICPNGGSGASCACTSPQVVGTNGLSLIHI